MILSQEETLIILLHDLYTFKIPVGHPNLSEEERSKLNKARELVAEVLRSYKKRIEEDGVEYPNYPLLRELTLPL